MTEKEIIKKYGKTHTFVIGFSGGKDSTATLIYLKEVLQLEKIVPVFADTGWEAKETYEYLDYIETAMCVDIVRLKPDCSQLFKKPNPKVPDPSKPLDFKELARIKGRVPSLGNVFCSTELKSKTIQKWFEEQPYQIISVSGVRREESPKRRSAKYFSETDNGYFKKPVWLPIVDLTWQQVFNLHKEYDIEPNPLYKQGYKRVGCFPCVNAGSCELRNIAKYHPERFDEMHELEKELGSTFFHKSLVPERYRRMDNGLASALDVRDYYLGKSADNETMDMFEDDDFEDIEAPACNSLYGLCE